MRLEGVDDYADDYEAFVADEAGRGSGMMRALDDEEEVAELDP